MSKTYRKSIRINGVLERSPRFKLKSDADAWYNNMLRKKQFQRDGQQAPIDTKMTLSDYVLGAWLPKRKAAYPDSTTYSDEQRYRDYIDPMLGKFKVSKINQLQVRTMIRNVVDVHKRSINTRNKVRSLISKIFNDAMNEDPPLRSDNPAYNISFDDPRKGKKKPQHIKRDEDILAFIKAAKKVGKDALIYVSLGLMSGLRKQEIIALRWNDFDVNECSLAIDEKFMQASNKIVPGTKAGEEETRVVPIPDELVTLLVKHKERSDFQSSDDFILSKKDGTNFGPREINRMLEMVSGISGVKASPHSLRHTYGRQFALKGGNMKALQAILGHSSSATTEIYSELAGRTVNKHRNVVSFNIEDEND